MSASHTTSIYSWRQLLAGGCGYSRHTVVTCSDGEGSDGHVGVALWYCGGGPPLAVVEALQNLWRSQRDSSIAIVQNVPEYVSGNVSNGTGMGVYHDVF